MWIRRLAAWRFVFLCLTAVVVAQVYAVTEKPAASIEEAVFVTVQSLIYAFVTACRWRRLKTSGIRGGDGSTPMPVVRHNVRSQECRLRGMDRDGGGDCLLKAAAQGKWALRGKQECVDI